MYLRRLVKYKDWLYKVKKGWKGLNGVEIGIPENQLLDNDVNTVDIYFCFLFQLLKLRKIRETNWWKHLMNSLYECIQMILEFVTIARATFYLKVPSPL